MAGDSASVLVYEDQMTLRVGLAHVLTEGCLQVVGTDRLPDDDGFTLTDDAADACIVGVGSDRNRTEDAIKTLKATAPGMAIVVSGSNDPLSMISRVYEAGARGYVNGAASHTDLVEAVRAVLRSTRLYFPPGLSDDLAEFYISGAWQLDPAVLLSETDLRIFTLLAQGKRHRDIAEIVGVTATSIGNRVAYLRQQLKIPRDEFTAVALRYNLITGSDSRSNISDAS